MGDKILAEERGDTGQHSCACQENKEKPQTIKQYKLDQQNKSEELLSVARKTFADDEHDHVVAVDGQKAHRKGNNIVEIVKGEEVPRRLVTNEEKSDINCKNGYLVAEEQAWYERYY